MRKRHQIYLLIVVMLFVFMSKASATENYVTCRIDWVSGDSAEVIVKWQKPDSRKLMITGWQMGAENILDIYYQVSQAEGYDKRMITLAGASFPVQVRLVDSSQIRDQKPIFKDVADSQEMDKAIANLYYQGILGGYPDGSFAPAKNVSRAEFAKILCEALKLQQLEDVKDSFQDIDSNWAKGYILVLADKGLVKGKAENNFDPDGNITLGEIFALLDRSFYLYGKAYPDDGSLSVHWSNRHYLAMKGQAVIKPADAIYTVYPATRLATRGEVALFLSRILEQKHDRR